jgi:hypothetical protein
MQFRRVPLPTSHNFALAAGVTRHPSLGCLKSILRHVLNLLYTSSTLAAVRALYAVLQEFGFEHPVLTSNFSSAMLQSVV